MTDKKENVDPLIKEVEDMGHPIGGIGNSISSIVHTQGWIHCHSAATDASGVVKAVMDDLIEYFVEMKLPGKLRIALACCLNMCGAVHCSDIAILGIHRRRPKSITRSSTKCVRSRTFPRLVRPRPSGRPPWTVSRLSRSSKSCVCSAPTVTLYVRPCP